MAKSPCLACPDRYLGCHSECERYMAFKDEKKEENAVRRKQVNENRIQTNQPTISRVLFSHKSDEWATPQVLFDELEAEFHFDVDACASDLNHKCDEYYTKTQDGLKVDWSGKTVFCNPPYSDIARWVEKCYREGTKDNTTVVLLIPSRTDTTYFHNFIYHRAEIRFVSGRLKFEGAKWNAPFPSMVVIFRGAYSK